MKKVLALTLVLVLALSMSTVAFAASYHTFDKDDWGTDVYFADTINGLGATAKVTDLMDLNIDVGPGGDKYAGTKIITKIGGVATGATTSVRALNNIDFKITFTKGGSVFDEAKLNKDTGVITVWFQENVLTVKDIDFKYTINGVIDGRAMTKDAVKYEGTYAITKEETDNDWFDFQGGDVLKPTAFIRDMEFIFSDDISVFGRALKNVLYKGKVTNSPNEADEQLMIDHPEIVGVYHLSDIAIASVANNVKFNNDDTSLIVYDGEFNRLGKVGDNNIPYRNTYYLAVSELNIDQDDIPEDDDEDDDEYEIGYGDNSGTGGDDLYPENPHDNPGTGK